MTVRGVIYDLDGTLVDSRLDFPAIKREMGLPLTVSILEGLAAIEPGPRRDACLAILDRHERAGAERATLMPGARELLESLDARSVRQAVLTRNNRASTAYVLERLGVRLSQVITREDCAHKPDPAGLLAICTAWQFSVSDVVFMGDYLHDLECGRNAGIRTILLTHERQPEYAPLADFCVPDFAAAGRLIERLLSEPG
jgi:HAD superfamily hydrolase (TIGR01509 family)